MGEEAGLGLQTYYLDRDEARTFGQNLLQKAASEWAQEQRRDQTSRVALDLIAEDVKAADIEEGRLPEGVEVDKIKRLVS